MPYMFQSRNRDACHFRLLPTIGHRCPRQCFNLAIEMLVISGRASPDTVARGQGSFNLAIEMLVISGHEPYS